MNGLYTELVKKMFLTHGDGMWVKGELVTIPPKTWRLQSVSQKTFAPHCSIRLLKLKVHLLDPFVDDLERVESFSFFGRKAT